MVAGPAAATAFLPTTSGTGFAQAISFRATSTVTQPLSTVALPWCGRGLPGWLPAGPTGDMPHAWQLRGAQEQKQHKAGARHRHRHLPTRLAADPTPVPRLVLPERKLCPTMVLDPTLQLWRIPPPVVLDPLQARWGWQGMGRSPFPPSLQRGSSDKSPRAGAGWRWQPARTASRGSRRSFGSACLASCLPEGSR